jgi:hypothetical protein
MMAQLEAHEVQLYKVFSSDYDFHVPDYQRPYAWKVEQAGQLLDDLTDALARDEEQPYFLGSIVLVKNRNEPRSAVIDGQQRLTTLTLLLSVLRDLADGDLAAEIGRLVLEPGNAGLDLEPKARLTLRSQDAEFLRAHVQAPGATTTLIGLGSNLSDPQTCLRDNAREFCEVLGTWTAETQLALYRLIVGSTYLVVVSSDDERSAHRIFSVMNARGLDLVPSDIFKASVIGAIPDGDAARAAYAAKWEDAEQALGRGEFADLFLHIRMIFARERARVELLKEFEDQVLSRYLPDQPKIFVDDVLAPYAQAHADMRARSYTTSSDLAAAINNWFRRLEQIDNNDWRPPALWALRHHREDPAWLEAFLRKLDRLAYSMLISRRYATPRANRYAEVLRELDAGDGPEAPALELDADEKAEAITGLRGEIYRVSPVVRAVLLRLDEVLANQGGASYDHQIISIEHVLPQTPDANSEWVHHFTEDQRTYWTHRLGNLVLLNRRKNSEARNFDFARKKSQYFTSKVGVSPFALTSQVIAESEWTLEVLERRQEQLVEVLMTEWDLLP